MEINEYIFGLSILQGKFKEPDVCYSLEEINLCLRSIR